MPARLKVFAARMGFFDTVVATSSRKAALEAWGVHQDLFKSGDAVETQDTAAVAAALGQPGVVLRRTVGSTEPYTEAAAPTAERLVPKDAPKPKAREKPAVKASPPPPPPDRSALDAAERALAEAERERDAVVKDFERRRAALAKEEEAAVSDASVRMRKFSAAVAKAADAYVKAGGRRP